MLKVDQQCLLIDSDTRSYPRTQGVTHSIFNLHCNFNFYRTMRGIPTMLSWLLLSIYHIAIRLRHDYTVKNWHVHFLRARRIVSHGSRRAIRRSRIVVVSGSNRTHIVISITSVVVECVVVSSYTTYRSLVVVESQLWYRLTIRLPFTQANKKGQLSLTNPRDACETFARFM